MMFLDYLNFPYDCWFNTYPHNIAVNNPKNTKTNLWSRPIHWIKKRVKGIEIDTIILD